MRITLFLLCLLLASCGDKHYMMYGSLGYTVEVSDEIYEDCLSAINPDTNQSYTFEECQDRKANFISAASGKISK